MKRILVFILLIGSALFVVDSCATREKCPAYGHYTDLNIEPNGNVAEAR